MTGKRPPKNRAMRPNLREPGNYRFGSLEILVNDPETAARQFAEMDESERQRAMGGPFPATELPFDLYGPGAILTPGFAFKVAFSNPWKAHLAPYLFRVPCRMDLAVGMDAAEGLFGRASLALPHSAGQEMLATWKDLESLRFSFARGDRIRLLYQARVIVEDMPPGVSSVTRAALVAACVSVAVGGRIHALSAEEIASATPGATVKLSGAAVLWTVYSTELDGLLNYVREAGELLVEARAETDAGRKAAETANRTNRTRAAQRKQSLLQAIRQALIDAKTEGEHRTYTAILNGFCFKEPKAKAKGRKVASPKFSAAEFVPLMSGRGGQQGEAELDEAETETPKFDFGKSQARKYLKELISKGELPTE